MQANSGSDRDDAPSPQPGPSVRSLVVLPAVQKLSPVRRIVSLLPRIYRLAAVGAIVWILHLHHARLRIDDLAPIKLDEVRPLLPAAADLVLDESDRLGLFVFDAQRHRIGYVLRTAPYSDQIMGYMGPTDTLIALDKDDRVVGIRIRSSRDTPEHVENVTKDAYFLKTWTGKSWDQVAGMDPQAAGIEGVSGASLTSLCIAHGIQYRFKKSTQASANRPQFELNPADFGCGLVLATAMVFTFTHLRGHVWLRRAFQAILIGYLGFYNGRLLSQSLLIGWAETNLPWRQAPGLVLLAAASLIVPWTSRRAFYCSSICPHGAAQEWMGRISRLRIHLPRGIDASLRWIPFLLIGYVIAVGIVNVPLNLAAIEPFDAYVPRIAGWATVAIAIGGLLTSAFIPMAYCKYGCPTGAALSIFRPHGRFDSFARRDVALALLVILTFTLYATYPEARAWVYRR